MKKLYFSLLALSLFFLASCLKDNPAVDFNTLNTIIEILPVNGGGLENFHAAALNFKSNSSIDSEIIVLNIASKIPLGTTLTIKMGVNDNLRSSYNSANQDQYDKFPDSTYSFPVTSGKIASGHRLDTLHVYFFPSKIDTTKSYMLPISITDAQGKTISGNFSTIYFHTN